MEESYLLSHIALPAPWVSLWSTAWQLLLMVRELYLVPSGCLTTSVSNMGKCKVFSLNSSKQFTHSITVELEKGTSCQLLCVWSKFPQQSVLAAGNMAYVISHVQMAWKEDNVVSQGLGIPFLGLLILLCGMDEVFPSIIFCIYEQEGLDNLEIHFHLWWTKRT